MRILFVSHDATKTGAPLCLLKIVKTLSSKHVCDVLFLQGGPLIAEFSACTHAVVVRKKISRKDYVGRLLRRVVKETSELEKLHSGLEGRSYDVLYANTIISLPYALVLNRYLRARLVYHNHEMHNSIMKFKLDDVLRDSIQSIDTLITVSDLSKNELVSKYDCPVERIRVVYPFARTVAVDASRVESLRCALGITKKTFVVGSAGYACTRKGVDLFVQTAIQFSKLTRNDDFVFIWVGEASGLQEYIYYIGYDLEKRNLAGKVVFVGEYTEPFDYYELFDVLYLCSREESFSLVALECAMLSKPIVFFEGAVGFADFATPENAKAVPYSDTCIAAEKILEFSEDAAKRQAFGRNARETAMYNFSEVQFEQSIQGIVKVINDSLGLPHPPVARVSFLGRLIKIAFRFIIRLFSGYFVQRYARDVRRREEVTYSARRYTVSRPRCLSRLPNEKHAANSTIRVVCFYLPQFHAIPENDAWWGQGFTEWTNVKPALPQFRGHYQPHVPHDDLGYYSLLSRETREKQIEIAKQYGIEGFCYYLYWFSGHRLLEQPLDAMLADPSLDFPFCVCWANENWSRRWNGREQELLMAQSHSPEDDIAFITEVSKYLRDQRYIRVNGKPLLLVYRPGLFPNMKETSARWRAWCHENGIGEIYLAYQQSFDRNDPREYGFDAAVEFPPTLGHLQNVASAVSGLGHEFRGVIHDWRDLLGKSDKFSPPSYQYFRGVTPSWDNTARRKNKGFILINSCPRLFFTALMNAFSETIRRIQDPQQRFVFINAWNEWGEGAHLEPDQRYGYAWLQSVYDAHSAMVEIQRARCAIVVNLDDDRALKRVLRRLAWVDVSRCKLYVTIGAGHIKNAERILRSRKYQCLVTENHMRDNNGMNFMGFVPQIMNDGYDFFVMIRAGQRGKEPLLQEESIDQLLSYQGYVRALSMFLHDAEIGVVTADMCGAGGSAALKDPIMCYGRTRFFADYVSVFSAGTHVENSLSNRLLSFLNARNYRVEPLRLREPQ